MADVAAPAPTAKIEPRWHKRNTLMYLRRKRVEIRKARDAIEKAKHELYQLGEEERVLEAEAVEWMERDNTRTEVVLEPEVRRVGEMQVAIVFTRNDYGSLTDVVVEPA